MTKPKSEPWVDELGVIITIGDCIDSLTTSAGLIAREMESSKSIKESLSMYAEYKRKLFIINKIKSMYVQSAMLIKQPTKQIPSKKKKERSH